jgi:dTMP kinase
MDDYKCSRGIFLTFEGGEGAGKSTCMHAVRHYLESRDIPVLFTREPGGTEIAEKIRQILIDPASEGLLPMTELLLFFAARCEHVNHVIRPAISRGTWVVSDRFTDASYAYQGGGRGVPKEWIQCLDSWVVNDMEPDCTLLFDLPVETGCQRVEKRGSKDRFEKEEMTFFERVRQAYLQRLKSAPERFVRIDASQSPEQVLEQVLPLLKNLIEKSAGDA